MGATGQVVLEVRVLLSTLSFSTLQSRPVSSPSTILLTATSQAAMSVTLPDGMIWQEHARLAYCTVCCALVPASSDKLIKQHCKSKTHKQQLKQRQDNGTSEVVSTNESPASPPRQWSRIVLTPPQEYQQNHLDALHIAGTFPDDSPLAGLYYMHHTCSRGSSDQPTPNAAAGAVGAAGIEDPLQAGTTAVQPRLNGSSSYPSSSSSSSSSSCSNSCEPIGCSSDAASDCTPAEQLQQRLQTQQLLEGKKQQQQQQQQQQQLLLCWPPPFGVRPKAAVAAGQPFLTLACGSIPCVPEDIDDALGWYCQPGACRLPNIDIGGINQQVKSWSHAAKLLRTAAAAVASDRSIEGGTQSCGDQNGTEAVVAGNGGLTCTTSSSSKPAPFWASLVADISHPAWWPKTGHVPTYDIVIVGAGGSGIGLHRDVDHSYCSNPPPVATYLTVSAGRKHVILMPPGQTLFPMDDRAPFPVNPSPELLHAIKAAGGAYFDLQPAPDGSPVTLFMPTGWLHWLVGDSEWHVVFGGSCHMRA